MTNPAFQATFADFRIVKGRKVAQIVLEIPLEAANAALETLGGVPMPDKEAWVGIARIDAKAAQAEAAIEPVKERRKFSELSYSQQAGMRCNEPTFWRFLADLYARVVNSSDDAAFIVRSLCKVTSRADIGSDQFARTVWGQINTEYEAWLRAAEHVEGAA